MDGDDFARLVAIGLVPPEAVDAQCRDIDAARVHFGEILCAEETIEICAGHARTLDNGPDGEEITMGMDVDDPHAPPADEYFLAGLRASAGRGQQQASGRHSSRVQKLPPVHTSASSAALTRAPPQVSALLRPPFIIRYLRAAGWVEHDHRAEEQRDSEVMSEVVNPVTPDAQPAMTCPRALPSSNVRISAKRESVNQ